MPPSGDGGTPIDSQNPTTAGDGTHGGDLSGEHGSSARDPHPPAAPSAGGIFSFLVRRPVAATMIFLAALVFGYVSFTRLPVELMPDISYPTITVRTAYDGAAPQEVESQISRPVEEALATLDGLVNMESRSRAGNSDVILGFDWGTDMSAASQRIREAMQTTFLPQEADRPLILRYDPSDEPFLRLALSYDASKLAMDDEEALFLLRELADEDIKRALEALPGVAAVRVRGGLEREIRIELKEEWLAARQLTADDVKAALQSDNVNLAGGSILEGSTEYLIRTLNEMHTVSDVRELKIRRTDGTVVPITDVAVITPTFAERQVVAELDGAQAVELELFKEADANVVEVAGRVDTMLNGTDVGFTQEDLDKMPPGRRKAMMQSMLSGAGGIASKLPAGVLLQTLDDQAAFIQLAIDNLTDAILLGGLFAVLILFLFLRDARATTIIGLAIPISVLIGFAPLYLGDVTLNLMSLGGLALGVGMLVDNAVVVLEAIQRHIEDGMDRREAASRGVSEVAMAVIASTLTTVAVFAPIGFVEGVGGELFGDLSMAVVGSLMASLMVSLFLVPTLAALDPKLSTATAALEAPPQGRIRWTLQPLGDIRHHFAATSGAKKWIGLPYVLLRALFMAFVRAVASVVTAVAGFFTFVAMWIWRRIGRFVGGIGTRGADVFQSQYHRLAESYGARLPGVLKSPGPVVAGAAVLFVGALLGARWLGTELLPEIHQGRLTVEAHLPVGTPLAETERTVRVLQTHIKSIPDVRTVYATVGSDGRADASSDEGPHSAKIRVLIEDGPGLADREEVVMASLRDLADVVPHMSTKITRPSLFSFQTPLEVVIFGQDLAQLQAWGDRVVADMSAIKGLTDVQTSLSAGHPEVQISYDRERLARLGLSTQQVASKVRDMIQGVEATRIHQADQRIALRVQLEEEQRSSLRDLQDLNINPSVVPPIPLDAVATFNEGVGPSEIRRVDQQRAVVVSASLAGFDLGSAITGVQELMGSLNLPGDMSWSLGGQAKEMSASMQSMQFALILAIFLVYLIMASTFENLLYPFVILFTLPLALVGVVAGLAVAGLPLSVVAFIGMIVLAGVVVNNAIVLVDAIQRHRSEGMEVIAAIETAGAERLRPILITTVTTVLGLLPLILFGKGAGAEIQKPLAVAVIGGLTVSTLLTLVVIPSVYLLMDRLVHGRDEEPAA